MSAASRAPNPTATRARHSAAGSMTSNTAATIPTAFSHMNMDICGGLGKTVFCETTICHGCLILNYVDIWSAHESNDQV